MERRREERKWVESTTGMEGERSGKERKGEERRGRGKERRVGEEEYEQEENVCALYLNSFSSL